MLCAAATATQGPRFSVGIAVHEQQCRRGTLLPREYEQLVETDVEFLPRPRQWLITGASGACQHRLK
jgi:hypothetical protein